MPIQSTTQPAGPHSGRQHGTHLRFLLVFFVDAISWSFPDPSNTFSTSRDLHVGQMEIFPVLS